MGLGHTWADSMRHLDGILENCDVISNFFMCIEKDRTFGSTVMRAFKSS